MFWILLFEQPPACAGLHEDNERLVAAIVRDYQKDAKSHKEKLAQNHRVKKALDTLQLQSERLVRPSADGCAAAGMHASQGQLRCCRTCISGLLACATCVNGVDRSNSCAAASVRGQGRRQEGGDRGSERGWRRDGVSICRPPSSPRHGVCGSSLWSWGAPTPRRPSHRGNQSSPSRVRRTFQARVKEVQDYHAKYPSTDTTEVRH